METLSYSQFKTLLKHGQVTELVVRDKDICGARLRTLEEALARAAGLSPAQWPQPRIHDRAEVLSVERMESFAALRGECTRIAEQLKIAPSTLAPRAALEAIARSRSRNLDEIMKSGGLLRWQAELVRGAVEKYWRSTASCSGVTRRCIGGLPNEN